MGINTPSGLPEKSPLQRKDTTKAALNELRTTLPQGNEQSSRVNLYDYNKPFYEQIRDTPNSKLTAVQTTLISSLRELGRVLLGNTESILFEAKLDPKTAWKGKIYMNDDYINAYFTYKGKEYTLQVDEDSASWDLFICEGRFQGDASTKNAFVKRTWLSQGGFEKARKEMFQEFKDKAK